MKCFPSGPNAFSCSSSRDEVIEAAKKKIATLKESLSSAKDANQRLTDEAAQNEDDKSRVQEKYKKLYKNVGVLKVKFFSFIGSQALVYSYQFSTGT